MQCSQLADLNHKIFIECMKILDKHKLIYHHKKGIFPLNRNIGKLFIFIIFFL